MYVGVCDPKESKKVTFKTTNRFTGICQSYPMAISEIEEKSLI
jgi:hypothetical protein